MRCGVALCDAGPRHKARRRVLYVITSARRSGRPERTNTRARVDRTQASTWCAIRDSNPNPLIMGFIDAMRAECHAVESICRVLREQGCQIAARTYRSWKQTTRHVAVLGKALTELDRRVPTP